MAESVDPGEVAGSLRPTPDLPKRLTDLTPVVLVGIAAWTVALVVLFLVRLVARDSSVTWLWTSVAGIVLGFVGLGIIVWQRAAARRGTKGAQRGI